MSNRIVSKAEYNKALKIVLKYEAQARAGKYQILYRLEKDGPDFREKYIKAKNPHDAISKFLKAAPATLNEVDCDVKFNGEEIYIGDHPAIKDYL